MENLPLILQVINLLGILFAVYIYFRKPQEESKINDVQFDLKLKNFAKEFTDKIGATDKVIANIRDNHIHTIESKLDTHIRDNQESNERNGKCLTAIETKLDLIMSGKIRI